MIKIMMFFMMNLLTDGSVMAQTVIPLNQGLCHDARIYGDTLFVATDNGLYSYALNEQNAAWKEYAFGGMKILNFCKSGKKIMADNYPKQPQGEFRQVLLLSEDFGKSSIDITPEDAIFDPQGSPCLKFWQVPDSPEHVLLDFYGNCRTWTETKDFGKSWNAKVPTDPNHGLLAFDPNNASHMLIYGGQSPGSDVAGAYILETTDNLQTLNNISFESEFSYYFTSMAFCPSNSQILLATNSNGIVRSTDCGRTWKHISNIKGKWYNHGCQVLFYPSNSEIAYAIRNEALDEEINAWEVFRSEDSGQSWKFSYAPDVYLLGNIIVAMIYGNELIIVSRKGSIMRIPVDVSTASITMYKSQDLDISHSIFDIQGRKLEAMPSKGLYIQNGKKVIVK
jgi:photosystem II stability/assembly factor-like uncharacterized protein